MNDKADIYLIRKHNKRDKKQNYKKIIIIIITTSNKSCAETVNLIKWSLC
jgi:hypothetical protein